MFFESISYTKGLVLPTQTAVLTFVNPCRKFFLSVELAMI